MLLCPKKSCSLLVPITLQKQPTTYLLKASKNTSRLIRGDFDTVAVRLTDNALISALCTKLGSALLSSSANITYGATTTV
jgi:L-threonylcarbamoyladenylate synthase